MIEFNKKRIDDFLSLINQENIDALESLLKEAIKEKIKNGWAIKENMTYDGHYQICCAIGALGPNETNNRSFFFSGKFFDWISCNLDVNQTFNVLNLIAGFDGSSEYGDKFYSLGRRLKEFAEELQGKN